MTIIEQATWGDAYEIVTWFALAGTVAAGLVWLALYGPEWYRGKRAAAVRFHQEANVRAQAPTTLAEAMQRIAKAFNDLGAQLVNGPAGTAKNPSDPSPRRRAR